ncbi:MAG: acetate--CoA ligase family protein [Prolixibacteraceae bacterium]|jgi:acetate---CoA ligase (ADP-forming)|nr:acetate--CoA ligase family protein [Prolixibacteraceae bacterium]MBT6767110.1 acetate--CoA ligase family protein [Prolixibacteraceae bacterium]MBT7000913.1 acetate--CoA ligase family protein [Prolixibacteraceae bacterium]MBT7394125.1 acetate--CoA ligase family protein [Prolixibacteraceae bacterium]
MINEKLLNPESIVIVGASNNISKPGGKMVKNLLDNNFQGELFSVNPKETSIQGLPTFNQVEDLPLVDLAVLAIPSKFCLHAVKVLAEQKNTKAFIIISAGFGETGKHGKQLENEIANVVTENNACLIGPNCIGVMTPAHASVFTTPIPKLTSAGCDFISGSGATAVFIIESGIPKGLQFANVFSVGNSAQTGVEDILAFLDQTYKPGISPKVKLLYIENINDPDKLLNHASSLIQKGCKIAAIKAGSSLAGNRAASSHTGALTSSDAAVEALFRKAGIVRCYGREELTTVANVFMCKELKGKQLAIITHAGGPGVMLTDALENGGLSIPQIENSPEKSALKEKLFAGSSLENPIDFLATGTAGQLSEIIDACENDFDVDGMAVIFGSSGLFPIRDVYQVLDKKMHSCKKPIYPILPSLIDVKDDVSYFLSHGNVNFPDEVLLGRALTKVINTPGPAKNEVFIDGVNVNEIRKIIDFSENGYQPPEVIHQLFDATGIPRVKEVVAKNETEAVLAALNIGFPMVMKVIGPLHKTDVGGVILNVRNVGEVRKEFHHLFEIEGVEGVLVAQMVSGTELFLGAKYEQNFGHVILCGMGGIYVEVLKDVTSGLAPLSEEEAMSMIKNLKSYRILKGYRKQPGVNIKRFAEILVRLSSLLRFATEIKELDINPFLGNETEILAVDARIRIEK